METQPAAAHRLPHISDSWQEGFAADGYAIFEGFIAEDHASRLRADVDELMIRRVRGEEPMVVSLPELGSLTSHPPTMELVASLMGSTYAMHHIHASRHDAGREGVGWPAPAGHA